MWGGWGVLLIYYLHLQEYKKCKYNKDGRIFKC